MAVEIVAEIGVNHQNDLETAFNLIAAAKAVGATVAKFQASTVSEEVSERAAPEHAAMLRAVVPTYDFLAQCKAECDRTGMEFLCTPAGLESLDWVVKLGVKRIKVASDNLTNHRFIKACEATTLPLIISTGMATLGEVCEVVEGVLMAATSATILHCTSEYPCPPEDAALLVMADYRQRFGGWHRVGWSDHTTSTALAAVAVGLGAEMIEKHLTLDRNAPGPDHRASLEPWQFKAMVENIREAEAAMSRDGVKRILPNERRTVRESRKSIVAAKAIAMNELFTIENLTVKRPGTGVPSSRLAEYLGKAAGRDYEPDELIAT